MLSGLTLSVCVMCVCMFTCVFCHVSIQVRAREEELINLTSLHTATKAAADKRIDALETRVTKLLEANRYRCMLYGGDGWCWWSCMVCYI